MHRTVEHLYLWQKAKDSKIQQELKKEIENMGKPKINSS
jgi:hypothetical protein